MQLSRKVRPSSRGVALPFVLLALIWGSTWIVIKDQVGSLPPGWTITWRFAVAAAGMWVLARLRRESLKISPQAHGIAVLIGLMQNCVNFQFVYRAEAYLASGIVATLFALLMVPNAILGWLLLGQRPSARFLAGSAIAIGGISLLLLHEYRAAPPQSHVLLGVAFTLGGLLCCSVSNVSQGHSALRATSGVALLVWAMLWGALLDAVFAAALYGPPVLPADPRYWAGVLYLGVIGTVVPFPIYFKLIRAIGAGKAAYNGVAVPIVAMSLTTLFEGYRWTGLTIAGSVLALAGLLIALSAPRQV